MAVFENEYSKLSTEFSEYAEKLDVSKDRYFEELSYVKEDGSIFYLPDPYMVRKSDWRSNMTAWPNITLADTQTFLTKCPGKNINSLESYNYVLSAKKEAKAAAGENAKSEKQTLLSQVKSFFVGETPKEAPKATPEEITPPPTPDPSAASASFKD